MRRAALLAAGVYAIGGVVWFWLADPMMRRDSTCAKALGCPLALPKHRKSAR